MSGVFRTPAAAAGPRDGPAEGVGFLTFRGADGLQASRALPGRHRRRDGCRHPPGEGPFPWPGL